ncbi:hypothetical protein GCM10010840_35050 [Deinococcus aerolatus]|uniref:Uncharacterized protein n=1 Tax=Deinococcus aerolatus TaxID=522487 RepID=A0ABQ2GFX9_9DEIO|nr:hypothetical protein [Deinococcus aerolatus]GGL94010.1 hypothetical protein GCM10010840_35050 [Deinococcus aerolatus]
MVRHARRRRIRQGGLLLPGAQRFQTRYATLDFSDEATLDAGALWLTSFALTDWTQDAEARIIALVKRLWAEVKAEVAETKAFRLLKRWQ